MGFTTKYLSDSIVNGFTLGCTFQIFVSQIATILGLKLGKIDIPLDLIAVYILSLITVSYIHFNSILKF